MSQSADIAVVFGIHRRQGVEPIALLSLYWRTVWLFGRGCFVVNLPTLASIPYIFIRIGNTHDFSVPMA